MNRALLEQATRLSVDDRLELASALWASVDREEDDLSPKTVALLNARLAEADADALGGRSWDEFRSELRERYGH